MPTIVTILTMIKNIIQFLSLNIIGIIFLFISAVFIRNRIVEHVYRKDKILNKSDRFKIRRDEDNENNIYLIDQKKKKYRHFFDWYTFHQKLGYCSNDAKRNFSSTLLKEDGYKIGKRIKIIDLIQLSRQLSEVEKDVRRIKETIARQK